MRKQSGLTAVGVKNAQPELGRDGRLHGRWIGDGENLYLAVSETGAKSWLFIWKKGGKLHRMGLGSVRNVSLADARKKAQAARKVLDKGKDPIAERNAAEEGSLTFGQAADRYISENEGDWRNLKHRQEWRHSLSTHAKDLTLMAVSEITSADVLHVLKPIWTKKTETAKRLRGRIERVLHWARQYHHRDGENPAKLELLPLPATRKRVQHHPAMDYTEVPAFMAKLRDMDSVQARALEFTILTAARSGETLGATWSEINLNDRLWTVPAHRMKANAQHVVPLSDRAVEIIRHMEKQKLNDFLFPGFRDGKKLSGMSLLRILQLAGATEVTVHGFRSSFRDWCGDQTAFPREVAEAALAHRVGDETERAYRRSAALEKRRKLMAMWALYCSRPEGTVAQFRRVR